MKIKSILKPFITEGLYMQNMIFAGSTSTFKNDNISQLAVYQQEFFEKCITKKQLAIFLCMSVGFINKMMNDGMPYRKYGKAVRFWLSDVLRWFQRKEMKS